MAELSHNELINAGRDAQRKAVSQLVQQDLYGVVDNKTACAKSNWGREFLRWMSIDAMANCSNYSSKCDIVGEWITSLQCVATNSLDAATTGEYTCEDDPDDASLVITGSGGTFSDGSVDRTIESWEWISQDDDGGGVIYAVIDGIATEITITFDGNCEEIQYQFSASWAGAETTHYSITGELNGTAENRGSLLPDKTKDCYRKVMLM